jgi:hypothetical protein
MRDDRAMRTTLDLDEDVLQAAKELASVRGHTTGQVISALARKGLESRSVGRARVRNGVPLLQTRPGSPRLTLKVVNALRDDA